MTHIDLRLGDCRELITTLADNSVHSIITDPPYEICMMGRSWDKTGIAYDISLWKECLRVLKPGGHLLSFSHSRTYHMMTCAIEDAGFEIRDQIMWVYAQGMPKSGTLKPCHEPICVARKQFKGSAKARMEQDGIGSYNIERCRVPVINEQDLADFENNHRVTERLPADRAGESLGLFEGGWKQRVGEAVIPQGRYPGNIITDGSECVCDLFPDSKGQQGNVTGNEPSAKTLNTFGEFLSRTPSSARGDVGSAARFFNTCEFSAEDYEIAERVLFYKKARGKEKGDGNNHISVKPTSLMRHLIRLVTPVGGTTLDIFMGSGSTGVAAKEEGMSFTGFENELESFNIAQRRIY